MVAEGTPLAIHEYDHVVDWAAAVRTVGCQVAPPSVEISTPATTPPPASVAAPEMVMAAPSAKFEPGAGEVIVEVGGVVSVDGLATTSPGISAYGWAPMSAKRL